jgi:hypothetical protein
MANRALGIGDGVLFPPARFETEHGAEYCMQQAKVLMVSITKDVETCKRWLESARRQCTHGEWGVLLKKHGVSRSTAWRILSDEDEPCQMSQNETNDSVDQGENNDLRNGTDVATEPPPSASQPDQPKKEREAGQDPPEPLDRAKKILEKEIEEANLRCQIGAAQIVGVKSQVRTALDSIKALWDAPRKQAKPVVEKLCQCGTSITLAQTITTGKTSAFERSQAVKGKFNLIDGFMVYSKHGGDYFLHRIRCPARKKT